MRKGLLKIHIVNSPSDEENEKGVFKIRCSINDLREFDNITLFVYDSNDVDGSIWLRPKQINYEALPELAVFEDGNLHNVIKEELGKEEVYLQDLVKIKALTATGKEIVNLSGIEKLTQLKFLNLTNNSIVDISPISNLTLLEELYLNNNPISSIGQPHILKKLKI